MNQDSRNLGYVCPSHKETLSLEGSTYKCLIGCTYEIKNLIPRFVPEDNYSNSFGVQWNLYRQTQLDSYTGLSISRDRLMRMLGGNFNIVKDKHVLEAGCGAGRFTEILLSEGADIVAIDLSNAVEANYKNCNSYPSYEVLQANILNLPFLSESFDVVICIGVIQHTPDPEKTIAALCSQLKSGGILIIDHYTYGYPTTISRKLLRSIMLNISPSAALNLCMIIGELLWPLHKISWKLRKLPIIGPLLRKGITSFSPLIDYHDAYIQLGNNSLKIWATLDMHDTVTDVYKHLRSADELKKCLIDNGMDSIEAVYAGNGVEVRAFKPSSREI